jgi:acyl-coenzyme A synthetase/AMP-(fatty) acid ligase
MGARDGSWIHWGRASAKYSPTFGPNDVRYPVLILGAIKVGYVIFTISPRNSIPALVDMFARLGCTKLLSPDPKPPPVIALLERHAMVHCPVPTLEQLLDEEHEHFPYDKAHPDACHDPLWIIHTSGSTGTPKPLTYTLESAVRSINYFAQSLPPCTESLDLLVQGKRVFNCFPPFHGACLASHLFNAAPFGTVMIAPLSGVTPTAHSIIEALDKTPADVAFLVPSIAVEFAQNPDLLQKLSEHVRLVLYCGGDLPRPAGDMIAAKVPLACVYGASEIGLIPQLRTTDWKYVRFHPCLGLKLEELADGLSELVVKRNPTKEPFQPSFELFPDATEYRTRDLFQPHPHVRDQWIWRARSDDIIVFLNGEKTNPVSFEQHVVAGCPQVSAAIVVEPSVFRRPCSSKWPRR